MTGVPAIAIQKLGKRFGAARALDSVSFDVPAGSIFGLIGPNGAGKTTTLRILATLLSPDGGRAEVFGIDVKEHPRRVRSLIGYMPDFFGVYPEMEVEEYLDFFGAAYGIDAKRRRTIVDDLLALVDLAARRRDRISTLSRGMQQRLGLARALVHDPKVLLLDEPASGLDPRGRLELMELLRELARMGKTILVSSHILSELRALCDGVAIIDRGKLRIAGSIASVLAHVRPVCRFRIRIEGDGGRAREVLSAIPQVREVSEDGPGCLAAALGADPDAAIVAKTLVEAGIGLRELAREPVALEDVFLALTQEGID
ncbi:MAG: ABC transporter ATP-binding protein [Planctomycetes bacterium]|nr:ABC transporter ATP-binding protein [Planctomycetota bacterium]